eukprot:ANDGO_06377.mRNA.1 Mitotic checkpoint protein BUB3.1
MSSAAGTTPASQFELPSAPTDGITALSFPEFVDSSILAVSSWDSQVRLYNCGSRTLEHAFQCRGPMMDVSFMDDEHKLIAGGLDKTVRMFDLNRTASSKSSKLGFHDDCVKCVGYLASKRVVVSGGWDSMVMYWDPRSPVLSTSNSVAKSILNGKVYSMSIAQASGKIVIATSDKKIYVFDSRRLDVPEDERPSALKYPTRCVECMPNGQGYVIGSVEGRVAVEYYRVEDDDKRFAFKCHRKKTENGAEDIVYPVNAVSFHPIFGSIATGGCDGTVQTWDLGGRRRISQLSSYASSISSLSFDKSGKRLAVAVSYTYEEGDKEHPKDAIFIRDVYDADVKPKTKS